MKTILTTLNAKYIHSSLALRLLYTANKGQHNISFKEFTIKESLENTASELLENKPNIIGIGVYIWNVTKVGELVSLLKNQNPNTIIILGGPEVSYQPQYFLNEWPIDYVVSGEGEFALDELITALKSNKSIEIEGVSSRQHISQTTAQADINKLVTLPSPYILPQDNDERKNKITYFETSRGCPYKCSYCLSSLEKGVRYFPIEYITANIKQLLGSGVKQIKFLDRTFNLNKERTIEIFEFFISIYKPGLKLQFEVYADLLTDDIIEMLNEKLPAGYFRFEIGIQSAHDIVNNAVDRRQDFEKTVKNINKLIQGKKIDLHLDLIAGLPYETFDMFVQSFNPVYALGAKELQLGFLKMLRGTKIRQSASIHQYQYCQYAPYEVISNKYITQNQLDQIRLAEHMLDRYHNSGRFTSTLNHVFSKTQFNNKYFDFFLSLGNYSSVNKFPKYGYSLEDLYCNINAFLNQNNINALQQLKTDYYSNFSRRPNGSFTVPLDKQKKKEIIKQILGDTEFMAKNNLSPQILDKQTTFDCYGNTVVVTIFEPDCKPLSISYRLSDS